MMNRRQFLAATAALTAVTPGLRAATTPARIPVVDSHVHCFSGPEDQRFPYHPRAPYRPEKATPPEHLLKLMDGAGVDFAIIVHPEPYQDDHRHLEHCLQAGKGRLKGTVLVFAEQPDSMAQLPGLVKRLPVIAARIHAYNEGRLPPFGKPELRRLWQQAGEHGLALQLHFVPRYAPGFEPLIREFKETHVIVDHMGRPFDGTPEENARVVRWADLPNVVMKLSALPAQNGEPVIRRLADAFGAERMIYGGGFDDKATAASYRQERERVAAWLEFLPAEARAKILGGNAAKFFGFGPA